MAARKTTRYGRATRTWGRGRRRETSSGIEDGQACTPASICICVSIQTCTVSPALTAIVRDSIGTGIYFVTYESVKQILANARGTSPTHPLAVVVAGGLCGLVSWACVGYLKLRARKYADRTRYSPSTQQRASTSATASLEARASNLGPKSSS
jgi:hypothetical protein